MSWPVVALGSVVTFLDQLRRPITAKDRIAGPFPYYGANGQQDSVDSYIFDEPLVLLAEDGGHFDEPQKGVAYRIDGPSWVNNHAHVLRPDESVDVEYLARVLENYDLRPFISGSTRGKLTKASAARVRIPLPPLPKQRRIADILDRADDLRAKRRRALALLGELENEFFKFSFPSDSLSSTKVTLGEIADVVSGITKGRKAPVGPLREVPYLAVSNVQAGHLNMSVVKTIDAAESEVDRLRLHRNDLLLTECGDPDKLGRGTLWADELPEAIHQNHVYRVRVHDRRIQPVFLNWFVRSDSARKYFLRSAKQTTGIASINMTQLRALPVDVPSESLQAEFIARVGEIATLRENHEVDLAKLDDLFASLQHRAFQGEL